MNRPPSHPSKPAHKARRTIRAVSPGEQPAKGQPGEDALDLNEWEPREKIGPTGPMKLDEMTQARIFRHRVFTVAPITVLCVVTLGILALFFVQGSGHMAKPFPDRLLFALAGTLVTSTAGLLIAVVKIR